MLLETERLKTVHTTRDIYIYIYIPYNKCRRSEYVLKHPRHNNCTVIISKLKLSRANTLQY